MGNWKYEFCLGDFVDARDGIRPFADLYWFAMDINGALGVFATAGVGLVPLGAIDDFDAHKALANMLFSEYEMDLVWNLSAQAGCYGYDIDYINGSPSMHANYVRQTIPIKPRIFQETLLLDSMRSCVVVLNFAFAATQCVEPKSMLHQFNT